MRRARSPAPAAMIAVVILLVAIIAYTYVSMTWNASSLGSAASSQTSVLETQGPLLTSYQAEIASLSANSSALRARLAGDLAAIQRDGVAIAALTAEAAADNLTIGWLNSNQTSLGARDSALSSQLSTLSAQLTQLDGTAASLQEQIAGLQVQLNTLRLRVDVVNGALEGSCKTPPTCVPRLSDYRFSVPKGSSENFTFTAGPAGGSFLFAISNSTSADTTLYSSVAPAQLGTKPVDVGSAGVVAYTPEEYDTFTVSVYDPSGAPFSATLSVWYFT